MKVIITKYAMTSGVFVRDGEAYQFAGRGFRCSVDHDTEYWSGDDWCKTGEQAIQDVELRFTRKLASLERQIKALNEKRAKAISAIQASGL